jgi:uncharacterized repeat protein (TIGR01451 family)
MKKIYLLTILSLFFLSARSQTGTFLAVNPDSAFQGQNLDVSVTYPTSVNLTTASPGEMLNFSGPGLSSFSTNYVSGFDPFNGIVAYNVNVPLNTIPGIYDVTGYLGHYDQWSWQFVIDSTYVLPQSFVVLETNVYGWLYLDNNGNGTYQPGLGDRVWGNKRIDVSPDNISVFTDYNGLFLLSLPPGSHTIQYSPGPGENITSANSPVTINVTGTSVHNLGYIGVQTPPVFNIYAGSWMGRRCNRVQNTYIAVSNYSNRAVDAEVTWVKPAAVDFWYSNPTPLSVSGDTIRWSLQGMNPGSYQYIIITDSVPAAGTVLTSTLDVVAFNGATPVDTVHQAMLTNVTCAIDPNDKSVTPAGISSSNYTLIGEDLYYHINFQNTGNDTAFDVIVRDTLDTDLDLSTFSFLGSSSPAIVKIDNNSRIVEFKMNNILLPDSNIDEPGSHGYVDYRIRHVNGILDGTEITNTAYIYFDFNSPVATNTTLNTMLSFVPVGLTNPVAEGDVSVYPNPFVQKASLLIPNPNNEKYDLQIWNELGQKVLQTSVHSDKYELSGSDFIPGIYFFKLENKNKVMEGKFVVTGK